MTGCHNRSNDQANSPLKTMLRKFGDKYQSYYTTYITHTITTHHRETGYTGKDRNLNFLVEDPRGIDIELNNDNESTHSSDTMIVFRGSEVDGHLGNPLSNSQANLTILTREINSL